MFTLFTIAPELVPRCPNTPNQRLQIYTHILYPPSHLGACSLDPSICVQTHPHMCTHSPAVCTRQQLPCIAVLELGCRIFFLQPSPSVNRPPLGVNRPDTAGTGLHPGLALPQEVESHGPMVPGQVGSFACAGLGSSGCQDARSFLLISGKGLALVGVPGPFRPAGDTEALTHS